MAPPSGTRTSSRIMAAAAATKNTLVLAKSRKTTRRKCYKKCQVQQQKNIQEPLSDEIIMPSNSSTATIEDVPKISDLDFETSVDSACSTPKAERFRIPEIATCPPAPKKQRVLTNYSVKRSPIAFFAHPDLEKLFVYSSPNISV